MDAAADDEIAQDTKKNQEVNAHLEPWPRVKHSGETNEGGGSERAGGDEHEAAVDFGLGAPVDGQGKRNGEGCYVQEGGPEQGCPEGEIGIKQVEAPHGDGGDDADYGDGDAERHAEPPKHAMDADVAGTDQGRLNDIQEHPCRKDDDMDR